MSNFEVLCTALEYMENHLCEEMKTEDIAKACYSVHDYLIRRRMMLAARRIVEKPEESILTIALDYGYSTNESFTRAFKSVWNCKPSEFRKRKFVEMFPRINIPLVNGDEYMSARRNVDISQLYDLFKERKNCYFICCDIKSLIPINEISHKAGDLAIIEAMRRMEKSAGEEDIIFRIGGDEFCMLTASEDAGYAEAVAEQIRSYNGNAFDYEDKQIPLRLYVVVTRLEGGNIRYNELFTELHMAIKDGKHE